MSYQDIYDLLLRRYAENCRLTEFKAFLAWVSLCGALDDYLVNVGHTLTYAQKESLVSLWESAKYHLDRTRPWKEVPVKVTRAPKCTSVVGILLAINLLLYVLVGIAYVYS